MKFTIYALSAVILIAGVLFIVFNDKQEKIVSTSANLSILNKDVSVKKIAETGFIKIENSTTLVSGDTVKTSGEGRAVITNENGSVTSLDYGSEATIKHLNTNESSIALNNGSLWARVEKVLGQGEYFEIETQNAVAVVRGTSFSVNFKDDKSEILVVDGSVKLIPKDKEGNRLESDSEIIDSNKKGVVKDGEIVVSNLEASDKNSEWFILNSTISEEKTEAIDTEIKTEVSEIRIETKTQTQVNTIKNAIIETPKTPLVKVDSIFPTKITLSNTSSSVITVKGSGFLKIGTVVLGKISIPSEYIKIKSDNELAITLAPGFKITGTYIVSILTLDGLTVSIPQSVAIDQQTAEIQNINNTSGR